jgi:hypothetical protein
MKASTLLLLFAAIRIASPLTCWAAPKQIIHFQQRSSISSIVANHAYIDTLPFDGIVVEYPDDFRAIGPSYVADYTNLYNQLSPVKGVLQKVTHNYALVLSGAHGLPDPFDDWTQEIQNWVILAEAVRDTGLEGIFYDNEEYRVRNWDYPQDCKYASVKAASQYQEQWRLRGQQVAQAILAHWPCFKIMHLVCPRNGTWLNGFFFMGMFAGAPGHVISGGELYSIRTTSGFSNWINFEDNILSQPPYSPPLIPSSLFTTWTSQNKQSFGIYDQDTSGSPAMTYSVLQQTIINALPYVDTFVWNYSENLDWLTPGAGAANNWIPAVWNARHAAGLPDPGVTSTSNPTPTPSPNPASSAR